MAKNNSQAANIVWSKTRFVTPPFTCEWAFVNKPLDKWGKREYKITMPLEPGNASHMALLKQLLDAENEYLKSIGKPAGKKFSGLKHEKEEDRWVIVFKKNADFGAPTVVGGDKKDLPEGVEVWSRDTVRVSFGLGFMDIPLKTGGKCYLQAVQLLESKGGRDAGAASVFDEVDGWEAPAATARVADDASDEDNFEEEEVPF